MPTIADYYVQIMPSAEGISGELSNIMDDAAGSAGSKASGTFGSKFSSGLLKANLGAEVIKAATTATINFGKSAISAGMDWETSFAQVQTIMDTTQMSTEDMSSAIQNLSSEMGISANEIAGTVYNAISATGDTANSVELAAQASKLATAGFTDTGSALSVLTTAMNAYGLSASEAESISDSLIQVQNLGVTTVSELASSMGKAIASASAYGVNLSNLESAYVSMTKSGINTAESTTYISSMLKELGSDGSTVSTILKQQTGKSFAELMNEGKSLGDVLGVLNDSVKGDATALMNLWSSAEAGKASNAIISQGLQEFNDNLDQIAGTAGTTQTAYETMADTLQHKTDVFKTLGTNLLTSIYEGMSGDLGEFVEIGNEALSKLSEGFSSGGVSGLMSSLGDVLSTLTSEIISRLPDIVSAGTELISALGQGLISNASLLLDAAFQIVNNLVTYLGQNASSITTGAVSLVKTLLSSIVSNLGLLIDAGLQLAMGLVEGLTEAIPDIIDYLPTLIEQICSVLTDHTADIFNAATSMFLALVECLPEIAISLADALPEIITSIVDFITGDGSEEILEASIMMFSEIAAALPQILGSLLYAVASVLESVVSGCLEFGAKFLAAGTALMLEVGNGLLEEGGQVLTDIISTVTGWVSGIADTVSQWADAGRNLIAGLWSGISDKANWLYSQITGMGQTVINKVKSLFGIKSPSKVFAEIGGYLAEGLGEGWNDEITDVKNDISKDLAFKGTLETNYSTTPSSNNALVGTSFTMYETIQLGDTKLKEIVSKYTIQQVGNETRAVKVAQGGYY